MYSSPFALSMRPRIDTCLVSSFSQVTTWPKSPPATNRATASNGSVDCISMAPCQQTLGSVEKPDISTSLSSSFSRRSTSASSTDCWGFSCIELCLRGMKACRLACGERTLSKTELMSKLVDGRRALSVSIDIGWAASTGVCEGRSRPGELGRTLCSSSSVSRSLSCGARNSVLSFAFSSSMTSSPLCVLRILGAVSSVRISCFSAASLIAAYSRCLSSLAISSVAMVDSSSAFRLPDKRRSMRKVFFLTLNMIVRRRSAKGELGPDGSPWCSAAA